jgi:hypothetical protein
MTTSFDKPGKSPWPSIELKSSTVEWARQLGYLETWQQILQTVDLPDTPT